MYLVVHTSGKFKNGSTTNLGGKPMGEYSPARNNDANIWREFSDEVRQRFAVFWGKGLPVVYAHYDAT